MKNAGDKVNVYSLIVENLKSQTLARKVTQANESRLKEVAHAKRIRLLQIKRNNRNDTESKNRWWPSKGKTVRVWSSVAKTSMSSPSESPSLPAIHRLARIGGVKRISSYIYEVTSFVLKSIEYI